MISTRLVELVIDTVVCLTLAKWETVSGQFGGYLNFGIGTLASGRNGAYIVWMNAQAQTRSFRERPERRGATDGSAHEPVTPNQAASPGPFARTQGAVRGDAKEPRLHSEQHSHHAAQAKVGEGIGADDRRGVGPGGQSRSRLQAHHRARGEPCRRLPILHGSHRRRRPALRGRRQKARRGLGVSDEPAL